MHVKEIKIKKLVVMEECPNCSADMTAEIDFFKDNKVMLKCRSCGHLTQRSVDILVINKGMGISRVFPK